MNRVVEQLNLASSQLSADSTTVSTGQKRGATDAAPKRLCHGSPLETLSASQGTSSTSSNRRHYLKRWEKEFNWLEYDEDMQGAFCKYCRKWCTASVRTGGTWITRPFTNWKKAVGKMKEHSESSGHILACQKESAATATLLNFSANSSNGAK